MKKVFIQFAAAAALSVAALSAQAVTLNLSNYANGSVNASGGAPVFNTNAGAFTGSLSDAPGFNANPFTTYCVQLTQTFGFGALLNYTVEGGGSYFGNQHPALPSTGAVIVDRLGKLFTSLGGVNVPTDATQSAAIQLAVWESIYEGSAALALGTGAFQVSSTAAAVFTATSTILANAAAVTTNLYTISVLQSATQQDFLLISRNGIPYGGNTPEPASLGLVALALGGLALSRRRRS
jgi:hypothetical protein